MYDLLSGYRVIEGATFVAGPSCGLHMAQMGAEVIRIDMIGGGPDFKRWPVRPNDGTSLYWEGLNKGKKSITIDTRLEEGRELVAALATASGKGAGLFLTNAPFGGFLSHERLAARRPDMITVRIMGWADGSPAMDYTVNAAAGVPLMTGPENSREPVNHVLPAWDLLAGVHASFAMSAALLRRQATGTGAEIRIPLSDVAATTMSHLGAIGEVLATGYDRPRVGNHVFGAFGRDFVCADGVRLNVVAITGRQWRALVRSLDLMRDIAAIETEIGVDFAKDEGLRFVHRARLDPLFEMAFASRTSDAIGRAFDQADVTWARYQSLHAAVTRDPRFVDENAQFQTITHPSGLTYPAAGPAATLALELREELRPAPRLGQHTDEILQSLLGFDSGTIADLHDRGIVA